MLREKDPCQTQESYLAELAINYVKYSKFYVNFKFKFFKTTILYGEGFFDVFRHTDITNFKNYILNF
jgi:hypothetical protein